MALDMRLPDYNDLDQMTKLVTGTDARFCDIDPANRVLIINLCLKADMADSMARLVGDVQDIRDWFKNSKLWEGRLT